MDEPGSFEQLAAVLETLAKLQSQETDREETLKAYKETHSDSMAEKVRSLIWPEQWREKEPDGFAKRLEKAERQLGMENNTVLSNICKTKAGLTIHQGDELMQAFRKEVEAGTSTGLASVIGKIIRKCTHKEAWVMLLYTKGVFHNCISRKRALVETNDLPQQKKQRKDFTFGLPFDPVHPKRPPHWAAVTNPSLGKLYVDLKYDGERLLIHRLGHSDYHFFSRNRIPVPERKLPECITAMLDKSLEGMQTCVLDSEILSKYTFGGLNPVSKDQIEQNPRIFIFDILYLNGGVTVDSVLEERRKILIETVKPVKNQVELASHITIDSLDPTERQKKLEEHLESVFSKQLEGVVVKPAKSTYSFGDKHTWLKVKRGYLNFPNTNRIERLGNLPDTLDLAVLGYFTGVKGGIEEAILGTWNEKKQKFVTVARCPVTGRNLDLPVNMEPIHRKKSKIPKHIAMHASMVPDYCLADGSSCTVLEIDGERLAESWDYTCDYIQVVRPILIKPRPDKSVESLTSFGDIIQMYLETNQDNNTANAQCDDLEGVDPTSEQIEMDLKTGTAKFLSGLKSPSERNRIYAYCCAHGGAWCKKGSMQVATDLFGAQPRADFSKKTHSLSDIVISDIRSNLTVCGLFAQFYPPGSTHSTTPTFDLDAWEVCLRKVSRYLHKSAPFASPPEVHLALPSPAVPGYDRDAMTSVILNYFVSKNIVVFLYDPTDLRVL
eukprot:TRINITY_DN12178_c0_g1_i1.p1 TRINITY_DN12178_c0_g1~~TRINITY_DN12178_c0_g1_i1.p1  ORF type:complete len:734 (+),score=111.52 TRINITY_DN12178_c0_g1_i1:41-2203(+)